LSLIYDAGSVCSWDYILLSLDIEGVVLLVENRPWEGEEKNLLGNYCLDLCNVRRSQRSRKGGIRIGFEMY